MKKLFALVLAAMMLLSCGTASAQGLAGLTGDTGSAKPLPDPVEVTESHGKLLQADYQFSEDYLCDAYVYETPEARDFVDMYTVICRKAGYTVTASDIDGAKGYTIQNGDGLYASLLPDFNGQMLLLVQKGMSFELQDRTNFATILYNNRAYELSLFSAEVWEFFDCWNLYFKCDRGLFEYIQITLPLSVIAGDEFYVSGTKHVDGFSLSLDMKDELLDTSEPLYGVRYDAIDGPGDYAHVVVETVEDVKDGVLIEGVFDGTFRSGDIVIEDFVFSAVVPQ